MQTPPATNMTASTAGSTKMVAAKVKIKLIRDCCLELPNKDNLNPAVSKAGTEHEVDEDTAKRLCKTHRGFFAFSGERYEEQNVQRTVRAVRV